MDPPESHEQSGHYITPFSGDNMTQSLYESLVEDMCLLSSKEDSHSYPDTSDVWQTAVDPIIELGKRRRSSQTERKGLSSTVRNVVVLPLDGSSAIPDDGFLWRKYGQKEVLGEIAPRCYYRCTHRDVLGCSATKQVQCKKDRVEVTYRGEHNHGPHEGSGNLYKRSRVDGTSSSQTSSVTTPFSCSSKSTVENPYLPDSDLKYLVDPLDYQELDSSILPSESKNLKWYFSLFPSDYEFDKDSLIQLWVAEGFITKELKMRMEDYGGAYFRFLVEEGFLVSSGYYHSCYKFTYKVNEAKIGERSIFDDNKLDDIPASSRHLSLQFMDINHRTSEAIKKCQHLSTLLLFPHHGSCVKHIPRDIFLSLKGVRVLNLSQSGIVEVPSSIGSMTSLRYLDVSKTSIKWLPESIGCLRELQTLKLRFCFYFLGLPKATRKLINLRHLDLDVVSQLNLMPAGLGCLIDLQTLSAFLIGEYDGCRIGELKNLNNLSGEFCLVRLENVVDSNEAIEAALWDKSYLRKLELKWSDSCSEAVDEEEKILGNLRPHRNLEELKIYFYSGSKLPTWISNPSYENIVSISFYKCRNCQFLPSIGNLANLKFLYINEMNCVKEINRQFFKNDDQDLVGCAFPKLEKLSIDVMLGLEEWKEIEFGDLPCLLKLTMKRCPELVTLPSFSGLNSLEHLEVIGCPKLASLPEGKLPTSLEFLLLKDCPLLKGRCSSETGEDWEKLCHVNSVWIDFEEISSQM